MKRNKKKAVLSALMVSSIGLATYISLHQSTIESYGATIGTPRVIYDPSTPPGKPPVWFYFNPNYKNGDNQQTPQSKFYGTRKMWREVYPGGFVWYSIVPPSYTDPSLKDTDMAQMLENRQKVLGEGGELLVKEAQDRKLPYRYNIKYGRIDPWTHSYKGYNSGSKTILYGDFKGKNYEWRFLGYDIRGTVIQNPYFPPDIGYKKYLNNTRHETALIFAKKNWIYHSWELSYSKDVFGESPYNYDRNLKIKWVKDYLFRDYPEFKQVHSDPAWWADRFMPMTDPSKNTGFWLGWHKVNGHLYYVTLVTSPPKQPNLRLIEYSIYDNKGKLVAQVTRGNGYNDIEAKQTIKQPFVHKGQTYRIKVKVRNMPDVPNDIKNIPITLDEMYSFDDKIGLATGYSVEKIESQKAKAPHQNNLKTGETAEFEYTYTVPTSKQPEDRIQFHARIPGKFYLKGYNTNDEDDKASIILDIAPENLAVEFDGYYDINKNPVDYVTPNFDMYVKYIVRKTEGTMPVKNPQLTVKVTDTKTSTINKTVNATGVYDKNGKPIADRTLKNKGDYAVFWVAYTPKVTRICTEASIPSKYAQQGVNGDPSDDYAKPACLINPDNIVVSNFHAKPKTVYLSKNQGSKSVQYTVTFDLTNFNYDKKDKVIPLVYTIDGKIVKTEEVPVQSLKTMKISRILPAVKVGKGKHIVQVEANPAPRKYVEYKINWRGEEVDPYLDNIGYDYVNVEVNRNDFACKIRHTANYWKTKFTIATWHGYWVTYPCENHGSHTYCEKDWDYSYPTISFYEKQEIQHVFFRSKYTKDKQGGWVDLLQQPGKIKAGYGFELKVVTKYETNTYNDTPKPFDYGCSYGRHVSPQYSVVDPTARLKITMPFTDDSGKPIAIILDGNQTGPWYNTTTTYELEERTVINKPERKIYINEKTKNGKYNIRIETEPFYGSSDKPYTNALLCDVKNVTIEVIGSYLDDLNTHIVQ